jgi:transcriptional regulator with XRE-family HTH domain
MKMTKNIKFKDWRTKKLQDPKYRAESIRQEPAYQVARLRMLKGLTQAELAELVGTKQSSIARLESGKSEPRLSFLRKVVEALGGKLETHIISEEDVLAAEEAALLESKEIPIGLTPYHKFLVFLSQSQEHYDNYATFSTDTVPINTERFIQ